MKPNNGKKTRRSKLLWRLILGLSLGSIVGYVASVVAGSAGSQCLILCNQAVAIPYFAVIGFLVAWR
jgi:hypothetical protein